VSRILELREQARKVRWLAAQLTEDRDRERLLKFAEELEEQADALDDSEQPPKGDA
jgi:hypothetical protein